MLKARCRFSRRATTAKKFHNANVSVLFSEVPHRLRVACSRVQIRAVFEQHLQDFQVAFGSGGKQRLVSVLIRNTHEKPATRAGRRNTVTITVTNAHEIRKVLRPLDRPRRSGGEAR